jgi:hypothetical protein
MENQTLLYILTVFVVLACLSMMGQAIAMIGLYRKVREVQEKTIPLIPRAEQLLAQAKTTLEQSSVQIQEISTKTHHILDSTRTQLTRVDEVVTDASTRAKVQLEKAQLVMDDTMNRVHETVAMVHGGVVKPLREINGLVTGVRAGFSALKKPKDPSSVVTQDEEMFI